MDTPNRLFFAFLIAAGVFFVFVRVWMWLNPRRDDRAHLDGILRQVAPGISATIDGGGLRFLHRGLEGRLDFISDQTEIQVQTRELIGQVVEVVPIGFPLSLLSGGRIRARGSKAEFDRIFRRPADEQLLLEVGVAYDLRMSPEGIVLRLHSLPGSAAALASWIACAFRIVDLAAGDAS